MALSELRESEFLKSTSLFRRVHVAGHDRSYA